MDDEAAQQLAAAAAREGGRVARARLGDPGFLRWKGHRDVVAGAILDVQNAILAILREGAPGDAILAEEGPEDEPLDVEADRLWVVDPICGSMNFVQGIPLFAIGIALRVAGQLRVGVVYDPMRDELFAGRYGTGATLNGRSITVLTTNLGPEFWEQSWVAADLPKDGPAVAEALKVFELISREVNQHLVIGSPALAMCYVAAGRLHAYWTLDARPWDVAAAGVIVREAGGLVTDAEGGSWLHSGGGYVVANPASHPWALRIIKLVREPSTKPRRGADA